MDEIKTLAQMYDFVCQKGPTYKQHAEAVKKIAQKCSSITELGVQQMISGTGLLYGLSESPLSPRSYLGIDMNPPPEDILNGAFMKEAWLLPGMPSLKEKTRAKFDSTRSVGRSHVIPKQLGNIKYAKQL